MIRRREMRALVCALVLLPLCSLHRAEARSLSEILERRTFSICADADALPFSQRSGAPAGLQIDLAKILADRIGVGLNVNWVVLRGAARGVNCDAIMGSLAQAHDDDAEESRPAAGGILRAALTHPYARQITRIVIAEGSPPVRTLDDLRGRSVAVIHASLAHHFLNANHVPVRTLYPSQEEILAAVANKEMSAGIVSDWIFGWYRKSHPESGLRILDSLVLDPDLDYNVAITLRNSDIGLLEKVNAILDELKSDGSVTKLFADYGITYRAPQSH
jgi:polar amino acid transport system substrate-binding protein